MNYLEEIKAETIIASSGVDDIDDFNIKSSGIFYRNFSGDYMSNDRNTINVSRNSLYHLLPEGLFLKENSLTQKTLQEQHDKIKEIKENISLYFQPFDMAFFKLTFELEKILQAIADKGNSVFLQDFVFDDPAFESPNPYIRKIMVLLPFVYELRGNIALLKDILKHVFAARKVDAIKIKPFFWRFIIHKERLSKQEYLKMDREVDVFFDFFQQWFLPVEIDCDFRIKDYKEKFVLKKLFILDYNTHL